MAVNINLDQTTEEEPSLDTETSPENEIDSRVDRLSELIAWDEAHKKDPRAKELQELKSALQKRADELAGNPGNNVSIRGNNSAVHFGPKGARREVIDPAGVRDIIGEEAFLGGVSIPLKLVDDYLTPPQKEKCLAISRSGSRSMKVTPVDE